MADESAIEKRGADASPLMGNANAQVGAAHKRMVAARLGDAADPLARAVANAAGIMDLAEACALRSGESAGLADSGAEVGMMACGSDGSSAELSVMAKTCSGLGTSNQSARLWARDLLSASEAMGVPGKALMAICGSLDASGGRLPHVIPGHLINHDYKKTGQPFQTWLAEPATLERVACAAFAVKPSTPRGSALLLITMRGAGGDGQDLHVLADRAALRDHVVAAAGSTTSDGRAFLRVGISDDAVEFAKILRLKRKGGDSGSRNSDQAQMVISPREILAAIASGAIPGKILREDPTPESLSIEAMAREGRPAAARAGVGRHERMGKLILASATLLGPQWEVGAACHSRVGVKAL